MDVKLGEHSYTLRDEFPGREGWLQIKAIQDAWPEDLDDYDAAVRFCAQVVTDWTLPGSPAEPESWTGIDARVVVRLMREAFDLLGAYRKN